jgi:hypothetical protein
MKGETDRYRRMYRQPKIDGYKIESFKFAALVVGGLPWLSKSGS